MPRLTPEKLYIANLRGAFPKSAVGYMPKEDALGALVQMTGQNFGLNAERWEKWFTRNPIVPPQSEELDHPELARRLRQK